MKALLVDLETAWRGGQNQALLILKGLRARGHQAEIVAAKGSALGERARESGLPVHFVSRGLFRLPAARKIRDLILSREIDLVHANEAHAVSAVWLAGGHKRVPFLISRRVVYPIGNSRASRARYQAAARIVANSKWVAEQAASSGAPRDKLTVVYEGTEIPPLFTGAQRNTARQRWGVSGEAPLLGCIGVLLPDKGQEWLIRALAELRKQLPSAKLLLAGDGPCRAKLVSLAQQLGVSHAVLLPGFVTDVESVYAALDTFLLPSFFEALNNSLLAAMAYKIPSIAVNKGALGEIIENEKSGLLVSGPDVAEICAATRRILENRDFAASLGKEGRERVERSFSAERMVDGMVRVYKEVLGSDGKTHS